MRFLSPCLIVIILIAPSSCKQKEKISSPPNIVIINIDDLGWADLGFMGSQYYESPNIDALASQGLVFTQGYAAASNCAPSRACMLTGLYSPRHGIYTVAPSDRGKSSDRRIIPIKTKDTLHDSLTTLAEVLNVFGYTTCQAGKWHLSNDSRDHGFDYNIGGSHAGHPTSYLPPYGNVKLESSDSTYLTDNIMDHVLEFLDNRENDLFFLYYAPYAVHTPIQQVDSLMHKFVNKTGPEGMNNAAYATMINNVDRNIGSLIAKLKDMEVYDNTLIIFTSDNGGLFRISQQKPLRSGKGSYYEGGIRVPLFFVWPERIKPDVNTETQVINLDFFPTINNIIGADLRGKHYDGINLAPLLLSNEKPGERPLFWHFPIYLENGNVDCRDQKFRTRPGSVIRYGDWKLQHYFEDGYIELFNLKEDPSEINNVAASKPEKVDELLNMLNAWRKTTGAPIPSVLNPEYIDESI